MIPIRPLKIPRDKILVQQNRNLTAIRPSHKQTHKMGLAQHRILPANEEHKTIPVSQHQINQLQISRILLKATAIKRATQGILQNQIRLLKLIADRISRLVNKAIHKMNYRRMTSNQTHRINHNQPNHNHPTRSNLTRSNLTRSQANLHQHPNPVRLG